MENKILYTHRYLWAFIVTMLSCYPVHAQLQAYGGKQNDNNCKVIYLVNPSETIFYIAGMKQNDVGSCYTFPEEKAGNTRYTINLSSNKDNYLLLLPKDTIVYNVLMKADDIRKEKALSILTKTSTKVIATNNDKKRNKQISKLDGKRITIAVIEK